MSLSRPDQSSPEGPIQPLTYMGDHQWLEEVGVTAVDQPWLTAANELMALGSISLNTRGGKSNREGIVQARSKFFGKLLHWDEAANPIHGTYDHYANRCPELIRPLVAVNVMRSLSGMGYDPSDVIVRAGFHILRLTNKSTMVQQLRGRRSLLSPRLDLELEDNIETDGGF